MLKYKEAVLVKYGAIFHYHVLENIQRENGVSLLKIQRDDFDIEELMP